MKKRSFPKLEIFIFYCFLFLLTACSSNRASDSKGAFPSRSQIDSGSEFNSKEEDNDIAGSEVGNGSQEKIDLEGFELFCDTSSAGKANCEVTGQNLQKISNVKWILYYKLPDSSYHELQINTNDKSANIDLPKDAEDILVKSLIFTDDSGEPNEIENISIPASSPQSTSENSSGNPSEEPRPNGEKVEDEQKEFSFSLDYNSQDRFGNSNSAVKFPDFGNISFPIAVEANSREGFRLSAWVKMDPKSIETVTKDIRLLMLRVGFNINIRWSKERGYWARFMCGEPLNVYGNKLLSVNATKWNLLELKVANNKVSFMVNNDKNTSVKMDVLNCLDPFTINNLNIGPNSSQTFWGDIDEVEFKLLGQEK